MKDVPYDRRPHNMVTGAGGQHPGALRRDSAAAALPSRAASAVSTPRPAVIVGNWR